MTAADYLAVVATLLMAGLFAIGAVVIVKALGANRVARALRLPPGEYE
jgi:NADH:ubiquinone oxidoreductase subunit 3 (subunit A)